MDFRLRTKETLAATALTFLVVATTALLQVLQITRLSTEEASRAADLMARQIYTQGRRVLARGTGQSPWEALRADRELRALIETSVSYAPDLVYVLVADRGDLVWLHSEHAKEGSKLPARPNLRHLTLANPLDRLFGLIHQGQVYEAVLPLDLDGRPFGSIRLGVSTSLLQQELWKSLRQTAVLAGVALPVAWVFAMLLTHLALQPIRRVTREVERLRRGEAPPARAALGREVEFQELAAQLDLLGEQLQAGPKSGGGEGRFQAVVDRLEDGFVFLTADQRLLYLNAAAESLLAPTGGAVVGRPLADVLGPDHPIRTVLQKARAADGALRNTIVQVPGAAGAREVLLSAVPLKDAQETMGTMLLLKNLESIKTLRSLVSYSAKLSALGRLTSGVAHEVKNPLNAMAIHVELLREKLGPEAGMVQENLDILQTEVGRLDRAMQGFLKFMRPQELAPAAVDLNELLGRIITLLAPEWESQGVRFDFQPDPDLPPIMADGELLHQAFLNIALNACQAMPTGGTCQIATHRDGDATARISVSDQGVGIPPEDRERIFALYYTTKPEGSGVGLSLVYRIVQLHDGSIEVTSEPNLGTTFTVQLPTG
jgi:signal transduction histidine kinase